MKRKTNVNIPISFCTVCMNRLHHLRETLPKNIEDNLDYDNLDHVLLDYNSQDGLGNWLKDNLSRFIETQRLKYYRTDEPHAFNMAHSRNMVSKLAGGDILCLVDADNFAGKGFAHYINLILTKRGNVFLTAINRRIVTNPKDVLGRMAFRKEDFLKIEGFDERMVSYGFEDYDLANRLEFSGLKRKLIKRTYLNAISHSKEERIANMSINIGFDRVFIRHIQPFMSEILFLFKDKTCSLGTIVNNYGRQLMNLKYLIQRRKIKYSDKLSKGDWDSGKWIEEGNYLKLLFNKEPLLTMLKKSQDGRQLYGDAKHYFIVEDSNLISDLILFHSVISNRNKMESNFKLKRVAINNGRFGSGNVFREFQSIGKFRR